MTIQLSQKEQEVADRVAHLLEEIPSLRDAKTPFQKRLAAMPILKKLRADIVDLEKHEGETREALAWCDAVLKASEDFPRWKLLPPKLEKNDCSRLHTLIAHLKESARYMGDRMKGDDPNSVPWDEVMPFVVQHDWAAAFKNATDYADGGFKLPYDMCAFEFRVSGRSVTVLAFQGEEQEPRFTTYVQFGNHWVSGEDNEKLPFSDFALSQIKAICVALDAEVASRSVVRASEALNRKRAEKGHIPLYSYHVVSLNRQYRIANPSGGQGTGTRKRLHFRRGHWRHYAEFKTWVRWTLVGNPELGFIDKEYRL
jgi:hypothetical protein